MRVLIDSNVLISAARSDAGKPYAAFLKAVLPPNQGVVCEQNLDEVRRIFNRKFPDKIPLMERFLALAIPAMEIISMPEAAISDEQQIPDADDRPLLRAAVAANVDVILTGDGDFLNSGIEYPKPLRPAEFLDMT